jgi:hypothetical protein
MNAEKYNVDKIYFGGFFIRGHAATIATLSYAIRFWSKGTKRALFLRHEGFLWVPLVLFSEVALIELLEELLERGLRMWNMMRQMEMGRVV